MKHLNIPRTVLCSVHNTYEFSFKIANYSIPQSSSHSVAQVRSVFWSKVFWGFPPPPSYLRNFRWVHGTTGIPEVRLSSLRGDAWKKISTRESCQSVSHVVGCYTRSGWRGGFHLRRFGEKKGPFEKGGKPHFGKDWQGFAVWVWLIFWCIGDLLNFRVGEYSNSEICCVIFFFSEKEETKWKRFWTDLLHLVTSKAKP